jgi:hypothetical protein
MNVQIIVASVSERIILAIVSVGVRLRILKPSVWVRLRILSIISQYKKVRISVYECTDNCSFCV